MRPQSAGRPSVTEDEWQRELIRLRLLDAAKNHSMRALFSKHSRELIAAEWIACNNHIVWAIKGRE